MSWADDVLTPLFSTLQLMSGSDQMTSMILSRVSIRRETSLHTNSVQTTGPTNAASCHQLPSNAKSSVQPAIYPSVPVQGSQPSSNHPRMPAISFHPLVREEELTSLLDPSPAAQVLIPDTETINKPLSR
jgi:hypothetical protein